MKIRKLAADRRSDRRAARGGGDVGECLGGSAGDRRAERDRDRPLHARLHRADPAARRPDRGHQGRPGHVRRGLRSHGRWRGDHEGHADAAGLGLQVVHGPGGAAPRRPGQDQPGHPRPDVSARVHHGRPPRREDHRAGAAPADLGDERPDLPRADAPRAGHPQERRRDAADRPARHRPGHQGDLPQPQLHRRGAAGRGGGRGAVRRLHGHHRLRPTRHDVHQNGEHHRWTSPARARVTSAPTARSSSAPIRSGSSTADTASSAPPTTWPRG